MSGLSRVPARRATARETTGTRVLATRPPPPAARPDLVWLIWAPLPLGLACVPLRGVIGTWALLPAGVIVVAVVAAVVWSLGGER